VADQDDWAKRLRAIADRLDESKIKLAPATALQRAHAAKQPALAAGSLLRRAAEAKLRALKARSTKGGPDRAAPTAGDELAEYNLRNKLDTEGAAPPSVGFEADPRTMTDALDLRQQQLANYRANYGTDDIATETAAQQAARIQHAAALRAQQQADAQMEVPAMRQDMLRAHAGMTNPLDGSDPNAGYAAYDSGPGQSFAQAHGAPGSAPLPPGWVDPYAADAPPEIGPGLFSWLK